MWRTLTKSTRRNLDAVEDDLEPAGSEEIEVTPDEVKAKAASLKGRRTPRRQGEKEREASCRRRGRAATGEGPVDRKTDRRTERY